MRSRPCRSKVNHIVAEEMASDTKEIAMLTGSVIGWPLSRLALSIFPLGSRRRKLACEGEVFFVSFRHGHVFGPSLRPLLVSRRTKTLIAHWARTSWFSIDGKSAHHVSSLNPLNFGEHSNMRAQT